MATNSDNRQTDLWDAHVSRIAALAEGRFGQPVTEVSAPGGARRASLRVHFDDWSVIATWRPKGPPAPLECHVLSELARVADVAPACLAVVEDVLFQSDLGPARVNREIAMRTGGDRTRLAEETVQSIFRLHGAAHETTLPGILPKIGTSAEWAASLINVVDVLDRFGAGVPDAFDRPAAMTALRARPERFVKWDCRAGNAILGADGRVRWIDFEGCGVRHGAEDFAWLLADEVWPVAPDEMLAMIRDGLSGVNAAERQAYLDYMALYTTLHAAERIALILREVTLSGWADKCDLLAADHVGCHPDFARRVAEAGAFFADQTALTRPLAQPLAEAACHFVTLAAHPIALAKKTDASDPSPSEHAKMQINVR